MKGAALIVSLLAASAARAQPPEPPPPPPPAPQVTTPVTTSPPAETTEKQVPGKEVNKEKYEAIAKHIEAGLAELRRPDVPATFALGMDTKNIQRPGTISDMAASLLNTINRDGSIRTGVAAEIAPYRALVTSHYTAEDWLKSGNNLDRLLDGFALSFATAQGTAATTPGGDPGPSRTSIGARLNLVQSGDVRKNTAYYDCDHQALANLNNLLKNRRPHLGEDLADESVPESIHKAAREALDACLEAADGGITWDVAGAMVSVGEPVSGASRLELWHAWSGVDLAWADNEARRYRGSLLVHGTGYRLGDKHVDLMGGGRIEAQNLSSVWASAVNFGLEGFVTRLAVGRSSAATSWGFGSTIDVDIGSALALSFGVQGLEKDSHLDLIVLTKVTGALNGKSKDLEYFRALAHR